MEGTMASQMKHLFVRTTVMVEGVIYLVPVPVLVYFVFFAFAWAKAVPLLFLEATTLAISLALVSGCLVRWLCMRPMLKAARGASDAADVARAIRAAYGLPFVESVSVFLRWLLAPGLFVSLPIYLMGKQSLLEAVSTTVFTGITGVVSIPLVFHICEAEASRFLAFLRQSGVWAEVKTRVRVGITTRLVVTLLLVICYPAGLFLYLIMLSNVGYMDLKSIPVGFGLLIFCSALLSVVVAVLFSRSVGSTLKGMNRSMGGVSEGDLTRELVVRDGDELGDLAHHYNSVISALSTSVQSVRDSAKNLAQWVDDISAASGALASASSHQQSSTQSVLTTVEQFSESLQAMTSRIATHAQTVTESAAAVEELSAGVASIARGAAAVRHTVGENVTSIGASREKIQSSIDGTLRMNESLGHISSAVRDIGNRFQRIEETLVILQEIAGQTNTLAMNAAIEAAHAGDAGRGFAIVASEVRRLAERSSQFVKEIGAIMKDIGKQVEQAVRSAEAGEKTSHEGRTAAQEAQTAVEGIMRSIAHIDTMVAEITRTTEEQAQAASHALAGFEALRTFSATVNGEVEAQASAAMQIAESIKSIGETTQKNTAASSRLSELAGALRAKSEELSVTVSKFKVRGG